MEDKKFDKIITVLCVVLLLATLADIGLTSFFLKDPAQENTDSVRWMIETFGMTNAMAFNLVTSCIAIFIYYYSGTVLIKNDKLAKSIIIVYILMGIYLRGYLGAASWLKLYYF